MCPFTEGREAFFKWLSSPESSLKIIFDPANVQRQKLTCSFLVISFAGTGIEMNRV